MSRGDDVLQTGYLNTLQKDQCFGCEACAQVCPKQCIAMTEDAEGFRYPVVAESVCIHCHLCNKACPYENAPEKNTERQLAFGGYSKDEEIRQGSTSGGAFSTIVNAWCGDYEDYAIFGAVADGLNVYHTYITDMKDLCAFRKSKYSQSMIGTAYKDCKQFLKDGKNVVFSGTPCHIAGLKSYLNDTNQTNLLTIEVVCEGVPSPWYVRKMNQWFEKKYKGPIESLDYRYKDGRKWDFQVMLAKIQGKYEMKIDRWFNPFWSIWLNHLMSRPSCYICPFTTKERNADITLGDLWGVHLYCPELYGRDGGASLIVCNSAKGREALKKAKKDLYGHKLDFYTALKYQGPMRNSIAENPDRGAFMADLTGDMTYEEINNKWAKGPSLKLLWQKYVWGNRQKVALWNFKRAIEARKGVKH